MNYFTITPSKKLQNLVRFFWVFEGNSLEEPYIYRSMADPCCELIFHYKGRFDEIRENGERNPSFLAGIHSQTSRYHRFITDEAFGIFGAYLYPFAVPFLLNASTKELTNQMPDLHSALGTPGKELEERMLFAPDNRHRCHILTEFLEQRADQFQPKEHPVFSAIKFVIHSNANISVRRLAERFNVSERQLERKFREFSGFTPKKYLRLVRFGETCKHYGNTDQQSLTEIAHACGYYDQSHFIKEFKNFSGYAPLDFFSGNAEGTEWRENLE